MFNKAEDIYPIKKQTIFLGHCAISPLYGRAATVMEKFNEDMSAHGISALSQYFDVVPRLHKNMAAFLKTSSENISYIHNTAEAFSLIANGYPFSPGDEIISYMYEYPSNHYPWVLQKQRGVDLVLLRDTKILQGCNHITKPMGWSMEELESRITRKTKIVAISHVQYTSGYAADLQALGQLCRDRGVDLVVDCAQSLGCLPVYPEEYNISAIASSGWKWLMGPMGSGLLYTAPEFREKLSETMVGPALMRQGLDYLDLSWTPHHDGRKFEYSTLPWDHVCGMNAVLEDIFLKYPIEEIRDEIFRLQDLFLQKIEQTDLKILLFSQKNRSGILAAEPSGNSKEIVDALAKKGVIITAPVGYLRFAPHFYNDEQQMETAAAYINEVVSDTKAQQDHDGA
jgi:cysteine desulfurase / selenocysteine lyase